MRRGRHYVVPAIVNFAASFGATIGQNACAGLYPAMLAVMIAPTVGVDLGPQREVRDCASKRKLSEFPKTPGGAARII
jgi:hypothetical protein